MKFRSWPLITIILAAVLSVGLYHGIAGTSGFPLDDAWIHQVYARNLALRGEFAFNPGQPSSGSTAPAWSILLAMGYRLGVNPQIWTSIWSWIFYLGSALLAARLSLSYFGDRKLACIAAGLAILEWHLAWAAVSGMEITLFTFFCLLYLLLLDVSASAVHLGMVAGILGLIRPEGLLLAGLYGLKLIMSRSSAKAIMKSVGRYTLPLSILMAPVILFNLAAGGSPFPNTAYAKFMQWGYPWKLINSINYLSEVVIYFIRGPLMLIVPFAIITAYQAWKAKNGRLIFPFAWLFILIGVYSVTLPSIYHHGRYLMPLIPVVIILSLNGLQICIKRFIGWRLFWSTYMALIALMVITLWINGAITYSKQVQLINENQGEAARWIDEHAPRDAVVATHDIGMMGYFGHRKIIDLAGLITPEIVPVLHDPEAIGKILLREDANYLALFPGFYQPLIGELNAEVVYSPAAASELEAMGLEPFIVLSIERRDLPDFAMRGTLFSKK